MKTPLSLLFLLAAALLSPGCTTWGYQSRTGSYYPPSDWNRVQVIWQPPAAGTYEEIGMCSVLGGAGFITSDVDMFNKLRKAAAQLGADAVIVMREGSSRAAFTSGSGASSAAWTPYGGNAYGGWSMSGGAFEYPRNFGIAIKWNRT